MGFSSGMSAGAGLVRTAEEIAAARRRGMGGSPSGFSTRTSMSPAASYVSTKDPIEEAQITADYQRSRQELAQVEQQQAALAATKGMESARLAKIDIDETRARGEKNAMEQQARDFQMSAASLAIGDTSLAEEYINNYGDPRMKVALKADAGGKIVATPNGGAAPMTFDNARNFYASFFGQLRPKGSDFALPAAEAQDWKMSIEDGRAFKIDSKSGRTEKVDSWNTETGGAGMGGSSDDTAPIKNAKYLGELAKKNDRPAAIRFLTSNSLIRQKNDYVQDVVKSARAALAYSGDDETFDAKQAERDAKQAWDDSVDEMLVSAGFPGKTPPPPLSGMAFAPSLARLAYNGPMRTGMTRNPMIEEATVLSKSPKKAGTKPAPEVVISQARAALAAKIPREKIIARMEELYPGLSQQL